MMKDETENIWGYKEKRKKTQANPNKSFKPVLIFQTCNPWNFRVELN
jgi:hypothetical protein